MQKYKEINGNDYVKDSRTTINETMQSIQSMNSGTAFPTNNLFEGMKCYRTDLKKTYTLTDVENNTWVEDAHASLSDEATHAAAADTATKVNAMVQSDKVGELVKAKMGDNDAFRIAVGGSSNNGWVELATADDGTESIYVRQYADAKVDGFVTPTRTATLLDGSGNTSFPGNVTAPTFSGSLNGNAATATKLATPRTLSMTGKASGSTTFDGSADAAINVTSVNADTAINDAQGQKIDITYEKIADASNAHTSLQNSINTKLDKTGGTATGAIVAPSFQTGNDDNNYFQCRKFRGEGDANTYYHAIDFGYAGHDQVDFYEYGGTWNFWSSQGSKKGGTLVGSIKQSGWNGNVVGNVTGNSTTATKLQTARTISLTGNASGSTTFDGSADINISVTVNESKHAAAATTVNATAPNGGTADLAFGTMAANDYARVRVGGSDDNGWLEIATTDNGNESIYVRQYSGSFLQDGAKSIKNEAILLDGNGNTKFPHDVTAANFVGHLAGNADTATHASSADSATTANTATSASVLNNSGNQTAITGAAEGGLRLYQAYENGYPTTYGNVLSIGGKGDGQILAGWSGADNGIERLYYRNRRDYCATWSEWKTVAYYDDINALAPTKTGDGASGTWGINISGNAVSATNADNAKTANTAKIISGFADIDNGNWGNCPGTYVAGFKENGGGAIQWRATNGKLYEKIGGSFWQREGAYEVIDTSTVNNYAPTKTGGGASGTWGINISGNADSATNADTVDGYHASDIINRISAANTGGIVAASLTANGYVKFANGLILQWGNKVGEGIPFPIAFPTACLAMIAGNTDGQGGKVNNIFAYPIDRTKYYMKNIEGSFGGNYVAIGV